MIIPLQSFGWGDIMFTRTLVTKIAKGDKVIWGTETHFVDGLNRGYGNEMFSFIDKRFLNIDYSRKDDYTVNGARILPIRWADSILKLPYTHAMRAKYDMYGMDYNEWKEHSMWNRGNRDKEIELFIALGLKSNEPYNLINNFFGSESQLRANIEVDNGLPNVYMQSYEGFSLFDWAMVIEQAENIHVVNSSILFMLEILDLKDKNPNLYSRKPIEKGFANVDYLFTKNYILHD